MTTQKEIKRMQFQIELLSEIVKCRYYQGDEEWCAHNEANEHSCYNCDGNVSKCDLPIGKE